MTLKFRCLNYYTSTKRHSQLTHFSKRLVSGNIIHSYVINNQRINVNTYSNQDVKQNTATSNYGGVIGGGQLSLPKTKKYILVKHKKNKI